MNKYELVQRIENFAPLEAQEKWDCSGWIIDSVGKNSVKKIMLALTPTNSVIQQAIDKNCDLIISHHPLFYVDCTLFNNFSPPIDIYCAHTNFDKANGGTTDRIIDVLGLANYKIELNHDFLRIVEFEISVVDFSDLIRRNFKNSRVVNNYNRNKLKRIAFCAGSGSDFIEDSTFLGADCLVTGDIKYHTAADSKIVLYDIGHFGSEIICLKVLESIISNGIEIVYANESDPLSPI